MEPALDVINRTLQGDARARSFLERTTSIYVLDLTDPSKPKTYGCWNFIHQALNEVERYETKYMQTCSPSDLKNGSGLVSHVRLLASAALRVARRSPASDKSIVATCIANAAEYHGSDSQSQWLIDLNLELREIVMGRIAAMAFDFSFHNNLGPHGYSAFADRVVMDTFCAILAANAVSTGPSAIHHFATEWIIPSSRNLPVFALVSVTQHLASEGSRKSAPAGTKDMLQQLSVPVVSVVVVPALADATTDNSVDTGSSPSLHQENSGVAAMALKTMKAWCDATDLSLPQAKHICSKVKLNIMDVLNDAMYSDSHAVVDSLADFVETTMQTASNTVISQGRMNQVRHIIQVDEASFKANFTAEQLKTIETKEMAAIVEEVVSAVGLQRLRFTERRNKGDDAVCRNLARIAASVSEAWRDVTPRDPSIKLDHGVIELLLQAAAHPSISVAGIALRVLPSLMSPSNSLAAKLLPVLQRRAITPHNVNAGTVSAVATDAFGVSFHDFLRFREDVLRDCLVGCWKADGNGYMDSCTSAVEEFCGDQATAGVSFHLEAALFCIEAAGVVAMEFLDSFQQTSQMKRCTHALARKPESLKSNPLTISRMSSLLQNYAHWFKRESGLDAAVDLASFAFTLLASQIDPLHESPAPLSVASRALQVILSVSPEHFATDAAIASLIGIWRDTYTKTEVSADDRIPLGLGLCRAISCLPDDMCLASFESMVSPTLECLESLSQSVAVVQEEADRSKQLARIAGEIRVLSEISREFSNTGPSDVSMQSGDPSLPIERRDGIAEPILSTIRRRAWSRIAQVASSHCDDENISRSVCLLLAELIPPQCSDDGSLTLLRDLGAIVSSMLASRNGGAVLFKGICSFLERLVSIHGATIDNGAVLVSQGASGSGNEKDICILTEGLFLGAVAHAHLCVTSNWTSSTEQRRGEHPYETRQVPSPKIRDSSNDIPGPLLSLLRLCLDDCPIFLIQLPAGQSTDRDAGDYLLPRVVDSAVASLNGTDTGLIVSAVKFLEALTAQASSKSDSVRTLVAEELIRVRTQMIRSLIHGFCGKYDFTSVASAAKLLFLLVRAYPSTDIEADLRLSLQQDCFTLGDKAKNATLCILGKCAQGLSPPSDLAVYFEQVWKIHQVEDSVALAGSDAVAFLVAKYCS